MDAVSGPGLMPSRIPAGWSDGSCHPQAILVSLDTPGVGEFIRDGLDEGTIRVMVTDSAEVVILPSSFWDKTFRLKDRRRLKARQEEVRRARMRAEWGGRPGP